MRTILGLILLFVSFIPATPAQQSTPAGNPSTPAASQQTYEVRIEFNRRVRMRDGVELSADVYRPDAAGRFPVIINRTPYTKTSAGTLTLAKYFVSHGYVFVAMDVLAMQGERLPSVTGRRILSPVQPALPGLTKRYEPVRT